MFARDLKSLASKGRTGSSPVNGTIRGWLNTRQQKNDKHWGLSKVLDEKAGYNVKIKTKLGRNFSEKTVTKYTAINKNGNYFVAKLIEEEGSRKR